MAYTKTVWVNGTAPALNATNMNKIEQGIADALPIDGTVEMTGKFVGRGQAATSYINGAGAIDSSSISGIYHQNSSAYLATGAANAFYTGVLSAPIISNDGTGGTNYAVSYGIIGAPSISSSSSTARVGVIGGSFNAGRGISTDTSINSNNYIYGINVNASQTLNLGVSSVTGSLIGAQISTNCLIGAATNHWGFNTNVRQGSVASSLANSSTTVTGGQISTYVGSSTGGASTVTNVYGMYISTSTGTSGAVTNQYQIYLAQSTNNGTITNKYALYSADASYPSYHAGNFLIGYTTSNGSYPLQVNGQIFATSATIATSDGRYKKDIVPLDDALSLVDKLNPVQFSWKDHPAHKFNTENPTIGFIAQEVSEVLKEKPYLNSVIKKSECTWETETGDFEDKQETKQVENEDGTFETITETVKVPVMQKHSEEFYGIAESNMIALLTKAIQELKAEVETLKAQINK